MSSFQSVSRELKEQILKDYLAGMNVKDIAKKYDFKYPRTVYFHLKPLSKEHKLEHMKNVIELEKNGELV